MSLGLPGSAFLGASRSKLAQALSKSIVPVGTSIVPRSLRKERLST